MYVNRAGQLTLSQATIATTGNTSSQDNRSFHGLNAANLTLDSSRTWTVTADSYMTALGDAGGISGTQIANISRTLSATGIPSLL